VILASDVPTGADAGKLAENGKGTLKIGRPETMFKLMKMLEKWEEDGVFDKLDNLIKTLPAINQRIEDMEELLKELENLPGIRADIVKIKKDLAEIKLNIQKKV